MRSKPESAAWEMMVDFANKIEYQFLAFVFCRHTGLDPVSRAFGA